MTNSHFALSCLFANSVWACMFWLSEKKLLGNKQSYTHLVWVVPQTLGPVHNAYKFHCVGGCCIFVNVLCYSDVISGALMGELGPSTPGRNAIIWRPRD